MSACDIIIPVWNQLEDTKLCIDSIERNTPYPHRIIIIDNASGNKAKKYLEDLKEKSAESVILLRSEKNEGFIKAVNKGIRFSGAEYVCLLNNDTIVTHGWLGEMVDIIAKNPFIGIVNPSSNTLGQELPDGVALEEYAGGSKGQRGLFVEIENGRGFCMCMKRKLFDEIGLFDEIYSMGNFEDIDFSLTAKKKGYSAVRALASYVYHKEQTSFNLLRSFKRDFEKNRRLFESKWGKTERVALVFKNISEISLGKSLDVLKKNCSKRSWIYIICLPVKTRNFFEMYSNLTFYHFQHFFYMSAFFKLLFKKKKINIIYSNNTFFSDCLKMLKVFHGAEVRKISTLK